LESYTKAIQLENDPVYFSNRSSCFYQIGDYKKAKEDALTSIQLDPLFEKGYLKAGKSCKKMG